MEFEGVLEPARGGGARVDIPAEVLTALARGTRFRVRGRFGDVAYRSSTMPTGDGHACLGVHKATREAAGVAFGERVVVEIEPDDATREIVVPEDLAAALDGGPDLRARFEALAPSRQRELADGVAAAKRPETRERRIARILEEIHGTARR